MAAWILIEGFLLNYMVTSAAIGSALGPGLGLLGAILGNQSIVDIATIIFTNALVRYALTSLLLLFTYWILIHGIGIYIKLQNYVIITCAVAYTAILALQYLIIPKATAIANLNNFLNIFEPNPDWYHNIINTATRLGADVNPPITLNATILLALVMGVAIWAMQANLNLGEIKGANNLKTVFVMMLIGGAGAWGFSLIQSVWSVNYWGRDFMVALGYLVGHSPETVANIGLNWRGGIILGGAVLMNPIIILIMTIGLFWNCMQSVLNQNIALSRVMLLKHLIEYCLTGSEELTE